MNSREKRGYPFTMQAMDLRVEYGGYQPDAPGTVDARRNQPKSQPSLAAKRVQQESSETYGTSNQCPSTQKDDRVLTDAPRTVDARREQTKSIPPLEAEPVEQESLETKGTSDKRSSTESDEPVPTDAPGTGDTRHEQPEL